MSELKAGDSITYEIAGEKLILTPMPWGRLKKVFKLISESWSELDPNDLNNSAKFLKWVGVILEARMNDLFPLLFDLKSNPFFNEAWVDENITLHHIQGIVKDAIKINGVGDFLAKTGNQARTVPQNSEQPELQEVGK